MVMPLHFLLVLSSLSIDMHKQLTVHTSRQYSMQGDNNGINIHLSFCMYTPLVWLRLLSLLHSLYSTKLLLVIYNNRDAILS